ncbi:thioredoxin family protein [Mammaliicoccus vitulinus]|uniref:glutaredoxin family protein n=1 Tax=Mammaliicoccus vitulinus TaxID=71237 RepID=UPI001AAD1C19|nr:thioredoxin family protein [Mammaliicoccus vitulinus]MBO3076728.1 thioredoxin family protein [Mammaliicoccus vitulinus]
MTKIYMFSTSHCTKCPEVKKALSDKDIEVTYIDVEETPEMAMKYVVMSVPTIVNIRKDKVKTYWGQADCLTFVDKL